MYRNSGQPAQYGHSSRTSSGGEGQTQAPFVSDQPSSEKASSSSTRTRGPLATSLGFLKGIGSHDKRFNKDGQPAKKRGPKPDSKPAANRRQELNRQAQRTHRERKETYIKALEDEATKLKVAYTEAVQDRNILATENQRLRELLAMHRIAIPPNLAHQHSATSRRSRPSEATLSSMQNTATYGSTYGSHENIPTLQSIPSVSTYSSATPSSSGYPPSQQPVPGGQLSLPLNQSDSPRTRGQSPQLVPGQPQQLAQQSQYSYDVDQLGVDFVLSLEAPCMAHVGAIVKEVNNPKNPEVGAMGHALMISCPTYAHFEQYPDDPVGVAVPDIPAPDLSRLLQVAETLDLNGEVTPIIAWRMLRTHERAAELKVEDVLAVRDELKTKMCCYGFGAVVEEFEARDAIQRVFAAKGGLR